MRKHLNSYLFSPLAWLLGILLLTLLVIVLMLVTPLGVKMLASGADSSLKQLTIKGVSGSLLTGLHIDKISWSDGDSLTLENVDLDLQQYNISKGRLVAKNIGAGSLTINLSGEKKEGGDITSLPNFGLPLNLNAHLIHLDSLRITKNIPDDPQSQTLLFQVENIQLIKVTINDGYLRYRKLIGNPIIMAEPLNINLSEGRLNMNQPHDIKTGGNISFKQKDIGEVDGNIQLAGTLTNYHFEGEVNHQHEKVGKQKINFLGQGDYKRIHLEKVKLDSPHGEIDLKGRLLWSPELRWALLVDGKKLSTKKFLPAWPADVEGQMRLSGTMIDGRLENQVNILQLEGKIREYELTLEGKVNQRGSVLTTEDLSLKLGDNQLKLTGRASEPYDLKWQLDAEDIAQALPHNMRNLKLGGSLKGSGELKGTTKKPQFKVKLIANRLVYNEFEQGKDSILLEGEAALVDGKTVLKDLVLKSGNNAIRATGKASEPFNIKWQIDADNLGQLSPKLAGQVKGTGVFTGTLKKPQFNIKLQANRLGFNDVKQGKEMILLEGGIALDNGVIQLNKLIAKSASNEVEVTGQVSEPLKLDIKINAQNIAQVSPDLAGRIKGGGQVIGSIKSPIIKVNISASNLRYKDTKLAQSELLVKGEVQMLDGVPMVKELSSKIGNNRIKISGRASSPFDLKWDINGKNLKQLMPELSGQLIAKGRLQGTIDNPIINAKVNAKGLHFKDFRLGSAVITAKTKNGNYNIKGDLKKFKTADQKISKAIFALNGRIENHTISVTADHEQVKLKLKANGGWRNKQWKGVVQKLTAIDTAAGDWRMQKPTPLTLSEKGFSSSQFCFSNKETQFCSKASWSKIAGIKAKGTLNKTPLSMLKRWLPDGVSLNGTVNGTYDIKQNNGKPKGTLKFNLPDSNFSFKDADGEEQILAYKGAELSGTIEDRIAKIKVRMEIVNRGHLSSDIKIKLSPEDGKHTIKGKALFDIPNINWAQSFIPHSRGLRGQFNSKLTFDGPLSKPRIVGNATLKNAYLRLPEAGTELTNINIDILADKPGRAQLKGKMFMGKGALNVNGDLDMRDVINWKANVKISGKDIRFMNTNEINATMSPDLVVNITPKIVAITGKVKIPQAYINLKDIPETSIDESDDAFIIGERKKGDKVSAIRIQPKVLIELGDKVKLNAFGLTAKLSGGVNITHNRRDILANGSLRVTEGKFQAYGQNLEINNGRLIFNGSPKLVGMDIRATRKIGDKVVGVHLGGNIRKPKSKIFSDPTMPESEALSFLLTGHSLSTSSGRESALLLSAVRGLGLSGDGSLISKIGSSLGLDDVNIVTGADLKNSELALGKRLGSRLYVRYLIGLFDQTQKIAIEYKINKVLSLEAQTTSDDFGFDFIYEIERD